MKTIEEIKDLCITYADKRMRACMDIGPQSHEDKAWFELVTAIEKLVAENEAVRRANLDCVDHFNQMKEELEAAKEALWQAQVNAAGEDA